MEPREEGKCCSGTASSLVLCSSRKKNVDTERRLPRNTGGLQNTGNHCSFDIHTADPVSNWTLFGFTNPVRGGHINAVWLCFADCRIRMVGKPLFQRYTGTYWGSWMKDAKPVDNTWSSRYWFTRHFTGKLLYEYRNLQVSKIFFSVSWVFVFHSKEADAFWSTGSFSIAEMHVILNDNSFFVLTGF